jgi:putative ABC transport system permease protein
MRTGDVLRTAGRALRAHRLRTVLTGLGIGVGVAAVVLLTAIGEGVHRYVLGEFTQFGTHIIAVIPGRTSTMGMSGGVIASVRPLTLEDAAALERLPRVVASVPMIQGNAEVSAAGRSRRTNVIGVDHDMPRVWRFEVAVGRFLPEDDLGGARAYVALGAGLARELFGNASPLGERIRVGGERYRVVGVLESKGQVLGFDLDDAIYVPISRALAMFDREGLMEIDVLYDPDAPAEEVVAAIERRLVARHGREDFTIITQQQMLDVLGSVLGVLTFAVAALGGISLVVGGVGILTIMTISVKERTAEIGLLRALGAEQGQVLVLFLAEAVALAALGGLGGLLAGAAGALALDLAVPALPVHLSWFYGGLAELIAIVIGLGAGVLPARRAARLDPVNSLRAE